MCRHNNEVEIMEYVASDQELRVEVPCIITMISHSNPYTNVVLTVDGDVVHKNSSAGVYKFYVAGELIKGITVHEWFSISAPDAHARVVVIEDINEIKETR